MKRKITILQPESNTPGHGISPIEVSSQPARPAQGALLVVDATPGGWRAQTLAERVSGR